MKDKLTYLVFGLLLSALLLSGCTPPNPARVATPAGQSPRPSDPVGARDAVLAYLAENYEGQAPAANLAWTEAHTNPEGSVGAESYEYVAGDWLIAVSYPVVAPENVVYTIAVTNDATDFRWEGQVDAQGQVTQTPAETEPTREGTTVLSTPVPFSALDYEGFWTYTHPEYSFSIMLAEDWVVDEITTSDPLMNGHMLSLYPRLQPQGVEGLLVRMTFRRVGEDALLWPTGVGEGEFVPQGTLDVAGHPARRVYFVCPTGQVQSVWYQGGEEQANIQRGDLEFGFIFTLTGVYCEGDHSLGGKVQRVGEMIIASLQVL